MKLNDLVTVFGCLIFLLGMVSVRADVIIHGTRVVYLSDARETTIQLSNSGLMPSLVQLWLDEGNLKSTPEDSTAPFVVTPPLSRINPNKSQSFRILSLPTSSQLSQQQETLYWLNVLEVPAKPNLERGESANYLQLAIRSRIKVFFRPKSIQQQADTASEKLQWFKRESKLLIKNPTAFFITIKSINKKIGQQNVELFAKGLMLSPYSEVSVAVDIQRNDKLIYITINDYGAQIESNIIFY